MDFSSSFQVKNTDIWGINEYVNTVNIVAHMVAGSLFNFFSEEITEAGRCNVLPNVDT